MADHSATTGRTSDAPVEMEWRALVHRMVYSWPYQPPDVIALETENIKCLLAMPTAPAATEPSSAPAPRSA